MIDGRPCGMSLPTHPCKTPSFPRGRAGRQKVQVVHQSERGETLRRHQNGGSRPFVSSSKPSLPLQIALLPCHKTLNLQTKRMLDGEIFPRSCPLRLHFLGITQQDQPYTNVSMSSSHFQLPQKYEKVFRPRVLKLLAGLHFANFGSPRKVGLINVVHMFLLIIPRHRRPFILSDLITQSILTTSY